MNDIIIKTVLDFYSDVEGIYLFGTYGTEDARPDSDVDIALLLSPTRAKEIRNIAISDCRDALEGELRREIDLINLRQVSTVFQFQIITTGQLIHTGSERAVQEFEMLTFSFYQKLNEERHSILESFYQTKRAYPV